MNEIVNDTDTDIKLREAVKRLISDAPVDKIIIFGSRARGDYHSDSDFDICVLLDDNIEAGIFTPISMWQSISDIGLTIQITPLRTSVFDISKYDLNSLSHDINRDGRVIYDRISHSPSP